MAEAVLMHAGEDIKKQREEEEAQREKEEKRKAHRDPRRLGVKENMG